MDRQPFGQHLVGARLDKYEILEEVGFGGMSVVFRARDAVLDREVALKVLHAHLAKREESRRRLRREAQAVAKLRHPNILEIYDFSGEDSEHAYLVTEFIHGPTLRAFLDQHQRTLPEIGAMLGLVLAEALQHAHVAGVIHRDVKPENVMIRDDGVVKLMDFGIAQLREAEKVTETGSLLGSPAHMAPEVVSGEEPDARADIFSFGTVLYFLTTGVLPFTGRNAAVVLRRIVEAQYDDPEIIDPRVGRRLGAIIRRCLAEAPADRYASMSDVAGELRAFLEEVGLTGVRNELRQFFLAPETYERALKTQLLTHLEREARLSMEQHEVARAADFVNRLLALDEHHEAGRRLLVRLDRRRRVAAIGAGLAALVALAGLLALALGALGGDPSTASSRLAQGGEGSGTSAGTGLAGEVATAGTGAESDELMVVAGPRERLSMVERAREAARDRGVEQAVGTELAATLIAPRVGRIEVAEASVGGVRGERSPDEDESGGAARHERERRRGEASLADGAVVTSPMAALGRDGGLVEEVVARAEEPERVPVHFHPGLRIVDLVVDNESRGDTAANSGGVLLAPGPHRVRYSHAWVEPAVQEFVVEPGASRVDVPRFPLTWRTANLNVVSEAEGTVLLEGVPVGATNAVIEVEISTPRPPLTVTVTVVANGELERFEGVQFNPAASVRLQSRF